ncbi:hypothetical protein L1987_29129 [Smallanthus sonchifolius]|uniref:Uncharacterized protein n=1 Tax=Smallanthus sonchifolius TaxID=185202 RepID=A0ACB9HZ15_9ASTR|nr:hypothetical protein L1987_29129 [Smallanthus sonchifolius]
MVEESLRIIKTGAIPSAEEFTSQIEPKNVPAVFRGCVNDWKALSKWNPSTGGLDYLEPLFLETKTLASINLWMNSAQARSSTHYDPHHNLLCVVSGSKQVDLWPPSSSPFLYPMHLYGEASNHSAVPIDKLDLSVHPRAAHLKKYSQRVILQAGDALFIPEGWFHQVDSENLTVAVNFWWQSE